MRLQALVNLIPSFLLYAHLQQAVFALPQSHPEARQQKTYNFLDRDVDSYVEKVLADWQSPGGVSVAFVRRDENGNWVDIETKGYGIATATGKRVTEDTTFNIGSNSKQFNTLAISMLIANQSITPRITWKTKVRDVIPEFNLTDDVAARDADLIDLMTHRTGYPLHDFSYTYTDDVATVIDKLQYHRQAAEFRDIWQYNNCMYIALSDFPPRLVGIPYGRYVKENIFDRLGMDSSGFSYQNANSRGQRADGMARQGLDVYSSPFAGSPRAVKYWAAQTGGDDGSVVAGAGGVITNAVDLAQWLRTLLNDGRHPDTNETVLPPGALQVISRAYSIQEGVPEWPEYSSIIYGAAQLQITYRGHLIVEHGGFIRGFNTQISRLPDDNFGVVVLTNDHEHGRVIGETIKNYIIDKALGLEPIDWNTRWLEKRSVVPPLATPRPANATPPAADWAEFSGVYNNPGYGSFEFCQVQPPNPNATESCNTLTANLTTILPNSVRSDIPTYFAFTDRPWFEYIRLEHFNANLWNVSLLISTPTNDPDLPYWTFNDRSSSDNLITAESEVVNGTVALGLAGFWGGLWDGASAGVPKPQGNTVLERSEVYFTKLGA